MKKILLALALVACTSDDNTNHMTPVEMCGTQPAAPGFTVAYGSDGYARLPNDQMLAISDFLNNSYEAWASCVSGIK